jgi:hypothetical protein
VNSLQEDWLEMDKEEQQGLYRQEEQFNAVSYNALRGQNRKASQ